MIAVAIAWDFYSIGSAAKWICSQEEPLTLSNVRIVKRSSTECMLRGTALFEV